MQQQRRISVKDFVNLTGIQQSQTASKVARLGQMAIRIVQSKLNAKVKELRHGLRQSRATPQGLVGLEGLHLVEEALRSGLKLDAVFVAQGHESLLSKPPLDAFHLSETTDAIALPQEVLNFAVTTDTPQPIAALLQISPWKWDGMLAARPISNSLLLVLSGIQDPGNLGAMIRTAEAFNATGIVCLPGTVSPWNPKTMRASAGSVFRVPMISASVPDCFEQLRHSGIQTIAAMAHHAAPLAEYALTQPTAFVIGSEGAGLPPAVAALCDSRVTIPCPGRVESLNAAIAASILLYEASRQRSHRGGA